MRTPEKSGHYPLMVDKQRAVILHVLLESRFTNPIGNAIFRALAQMHNIDMQEVEALIEELYQKKHQMGWCNDPHCKYKEEKHGN